VFRCSLISEFAHRLRPGFSSWRGYVSLLRVDKTELSTLIRANGENIWIRGVHGLNLVLYLWSYLDISLTSEIDYVAVMHTER